MTAKKAKQKGPGPSIGILVYRKSSSLIIKLIDTISMSGHSTEDAVANNSETIENAMNSLSLEDVRLEGGLSAKRMRMEVLKGSFASTTSCPGNEWKAPDFKLYVFVSSTFTDTQI